MNTTTLETEVTGAENGDQLEERAAEVSSFAEGVIDITTRREDDDIKGRRPSLRSSRGASTHRTVPLHVALPQHRGVPSLQDLW